jgi:hypothetical protein
MRTMSTLEIIPASTSPDVELSCPPRVRAAGQRINEELIKAGPDILRVGVAHKRVLPITQPERSHIIRGDTPSLGPKAPQALYETRREMDKAMVKLLGRPSEISDEELERRITAWEQLQEELIRRPRRTAQETINEARRIIRAQPEIMPRSILPKQLLQSFLDWINTE